jgi:hypothetical protein
MYSLLLRVVTMRRRVFDYQSYLTSYEPRHYLLSKPLKGFSYSRVRRKYLCCQNYFILSEPTCLDTTVQTSPVRQVSGTLTFLQMPSDIDDSSHLPRAKAF